MQQRSPLKYGCETRRFGCATKLEDEGPQRFKYMQPQSKMVVQEEDSTVQTKPKMEVQDDVQPTEKSNVQPKSKIGVQEGSNMQLESSLVFHVELTRQLAWEMVVPEDSQLFPDIANSQV